MQDILMALLQIESELRFAVNGFQKRIKEIIKYYPDVVDYLNANRKNTFLITLMIHEPNESDLIKFVLERTNNLSNAFDTAVENGVSEEIIDLIDYKMAENLVRKIERKIEFT